MEATTRKSRTVSERPRPRRKTEQLVLRMDPDQKALLEQAAAASGRTITDIMTEGARDKALQIIREDKELASWRLSRVDAACFVKALLEPRMPTSQMVGDYEAYLASKASRFDSPDMTQETA